MADEKFELSAQQLDQTVGGERTVNGFNERTIINSKHQIIGTRAGKKMDKIRFVPCDKCGRPMHQGTLSLWYCDPCNRHLCEVNYYDWHGTLNELKAASL